MQINDKSQTNPTICRIGSPNRVDIYLNGFEINPIE